MFKNGDRVKVIKVRGDDGLYFYAGATGEVIDDTHQTALEVMFDKDARGEKDSWWIGGNQLKLLVEEINE